MRCPDSEQREQLTSPQTLRRDRNAARQENRPRRQEDRRIRRDGSQRGEEGCSLRKSAAPAKKAAVAAKKAAAVKAAPQVTITLKQCAAELAEGHDLPKKIAEAMLADLVTLATEHLKRVTKSV